MSKTKKPAPTSSVSFSLSRWFHKITTNAPSLTLITVAAVAYAIFIFGGGLYTLIIQPLPSAYFNGVFYFLYPDLSYQFISDTVITVILYALGFAGLLMVYQSTKNAYKPRQAYMMLIIGVTFLLLAYLFLEGSYNFKLYGGQ